jgi:hypothetical protein
LKTVSLEWNAFMRGETIAKDAKSATSIIAKTALGVHVMLVPQKALAAAVVTNASAWSNVFVTALAIADWTCLGVIIFAGATWMFGNRTKAIELLLGGAIGYLIIRHAQDIRDWLRTI